MSAIVARLRTFSTPRLSLALLLAGLAGQAVARGRMTTASADATAAVASLDSAINIAVPVPDDTTAASAERLRTLVTRKRDAEVNARNAATPWFYAVLLSGGLITAAVVTGAQALLAHVRGEK